MEFDLFWHKSSWFFFFTVCRLAGKKFKPETGLTQFIIFLRSYPNNYNAIKLHSLRNFPIWQNLTENSRQFPNLATLPRSSMNEENILTDKKWGKHQRYSERCANRAHSIMRKLDHWPCCKVYNNGESLTGGSVAARFDRGIFEKYCPVEDSPAIGRRGRMFAVLWTLGLGLFLTIPEAQTHPTGLPQLLDFYTPTSPQIKNEQCRKHSLLYLEELRKFSLWATQSKFDFFKISFLIFALSVWFVY